MTNKKSETWDVTSVENRLDVARIVLCDIRDNLKEDKDYDPTTTVKRLIYFIDHGVVPHKGKVL